MESYSSVHFLIFLCGCWAISFFSHSNASFAYEGELDQSKQMTLLGLQLYINVFMAVYKKKNSLLFFVASTFFFFFSVLHFLSDVICTHKKINKMKTLLLLYVWKHVYPCIRPLRNSFIFLLLLFFFSIRCNTLLNEKKKKHKRVLERCIHN